MTIDTGVRKRRMEADYINVGTAERQEFALCGTGFTALTESPGAQTSSKRYINMSSARQSVTGYEWGASFEADQIKSENALAYILNIGRKLLTGQEAETQFLQVDLDSPIDGKVDTYTARLRDVAIAVSEMPDNDGELGVNGDFLGVSDPVEGEFNVKTDTFTAAADVVSPSV